MYRARRRIVVPLAIVMALAVTPALSGCFGGVEGIVKGVTGGNVDLGGKKVPDDFPSDVPLFKGDVVLGAGVGTGDKKIWNVTIKVPDANAYTTIKSELESAGFTGDFSNATDTGATGEFKNDKHGVLIVVVKGDSASGWVANYTVGPVTQPTG